MRRLFERGALTGITLLFTLAFQAFQAREARAQGCSSAYLSTCINSDSYWPHAGPQRFAAVGSAETTANQQIAFGLVTTYLSRPIIVQGPAPGGGGTAQNAIDNQVNANFLFAYGVTDRLQVDVGVPITLAQTGVGTSPITAGRGIRDTAVRDMRFGLAYAIIPRKRMDLAQAASEGGAGKGFALAGRLTMSAPVGDNTDFAGERSVVFAPSLAADYRVSRLFFGAEVGARLRPTTEFAAARIGSQITTALGGGIDILERERLALLVEGRAYFNLPEQHTGVQTPNGLSSRPNGETIIPAEWMVGVRSAPVLAGDVAFFAGGGGPIPLSEDPITVPRFRFVLGVTYAPIGRDSDGDGVLDRIDRCPTRPGIRSGERPGCPAEEQPAAPAPVERAPQNDRAPAAKPVAPTAPPPPTFEPRAVPPQ